VIFAKSKKLKTVFVISLVISLCLASVFAYARYAKTVSVSTVYCSAKANPPTMAYTPLVYDFGCYFSGENEQFESTICIEDTSAINGTLNFAWDADTAEISDVTATVEGYTPDANGRYKITSDSRTVSIPFSLNVIATSRVGRAYVDVSWTPDGAQTPTLFSRYLISLNPYNENAAKPQIIANKTSLITNSLFSLGAVCDGDVLASRGIGLNENFEQGTVYYSIDYPGGVTLIRDSFIHLTAKDDGILGAVIKFKTEMTEDVSISIGKHPSVCVATTSSPAGVAHSLQAEFDKAIPTLNTASPLTLTVTEAAAFVDSDWNDSAVEGTQLNWSIERFDGKKFVADTPFASVEQNKIKLMLQDDNKPAGTYRLVLIQKYNGFMISKLDKIFFIDYR